MLRRFEGGARTLSFALARRPASSRSLGSLLRRAAFPAAQPLIGNGLSRIGVRTYAQGPPGGGMGGFPGFSMGQQRQKGDALKEFVSIPFRDISRLLNFSLFALILINWFCRVSILPNWRRTVNWTLPSAGTKVHK